MALVGTASALRFSRVSKINISIKIQVGKYHVSHTEHHFCSEKLFYCIEVLKRNDIGSSNIITLNSPSNQSNSIKIAKKRDTSICTQA